MSEPDHVNEGTKAAEKYSDDRTERMHFRQGWDDACNHLLAEASTLRGEVERLRAELGAIAKGLSCAATKMPPGIARARVRDCIDELRAAATRPLLKAPPGDPGPPGESAGETVDVVVTVDDDVFVTKIHAQGREFLPTGETARASEAERDAALRERATLAARVSELEAALRDAVRGLEHLADFYSHELHEHWRLVRDMTVASRALLKASLAARPQGTDDGGGFSEKWREADRALENNSNRASALQKERIPDGG